LYTLKDYKKILEERLLLPVKISKFIEDIIQATEYLLSISKNNPSDFELNWFWYKFKNVNDYCFLLSYSIDKNLEDFILRLINHYENNYKNNIIEEPLLSGEEIMKLLNLKPSKEVGIIKDSLIKAQIGGKVKTKAEATKFVKEFKSK
jgi:poly(A) polymerase